MNRNATPDFDLELVKLPEGHVFAKMPLVAGVAGLVSLAAAVALGLADPRQFLFSYLAAFCFFLSLSLGAMFFVLIQFLTRAGWSVVIRRIAENLMGIMPLLVILFAPIAVGSRALFPWADAAALRQDYLLQLKSPYLNQTFFLLRACTYFACWIGISRYFLNRSIAQDASGDKGITRTLQRAAGPAVLVYGITQSFAAFDWIMSLDPHWISTIFGVYFFSGSIVGAFALLSVIALLMRSTGLLEGIVTVEHFHDLGKLLFAFTVFWAYIAFSQYFLIWYANIPEETIWFAHRFTGSWKSVSLVVAIGHFVVPFFFLLPRVIKRKTGTLLAASVWMFAMHYVDIYWLVMPNLHQHDVLFQLTDVLNLVGIGGLFLSAFAWMLKRSALIPVKDPRLQESLSFENV